LRLTPHATHFSLDEAVAVAKELEPRMTYLTHMSHDIDYQQASRLLPPNIRPAHDGLRIELT
jgi:phosphoribosyl 1,2-cyclic phosphate phosphodiesterase